MKNGDAAVNLVNYSGDAWITATLSNYDGASRGIVKLQCGTRKELLF